MCVCVYESNKNNELRGLQPFSLNVVKMRKKGAHLVSKRSLITSFHDLQLRFSAVRNQTVEDYCKARSVRFVGAVRATRLQTDACTR